MYHYKKCTTNELIELMAHSQSTGHQVSRKLGILNVTKVFFLKNAFIYTFELNENFVFRKKYRFSTDEFKTKYGDAQWVYEYPIN